MKKIRFTLSVLFLLCIGISAIAQTKIPIQGTVFDKNNEPVIGATIVEKGTSNGTVTDIDGKFKLNVSSKSATIRISYTGYDAFELSAANADGFKKVTLHESAVMLNEVVAIGYGVQKKSDKTGAVMNVGSDEFNRGVLTDPIQAIQGKASGVQITKKGGNPNDGFSVQIRGAGGLSTGSSPLYVVDNVPGVDPTTIAPEDIESFNILKDASSTAIYGSRGANGVIIITTKKGTGGKEAKNSIDVNSYVSVDQVAKRLDLLSADEIRSFIQRNNITHNDAKASTDWQDEIYQRGLSQNYNIAVGGANDKSNYRVSGTWTDFEGVVKGTSKQRLIVNSNVTQKLLNDKLVVDGSISGTFEENDYEDFGGNGPTDIMYQAFQRSPLHPVKNPDGSFYENTPYGFQYYNPLAVINDIQNQRSAKRFRANGSAQYELIKGLTAKVSGAYTRDDYESFYFVPSNQPTSMTKGRGERKYENTNTKLLESFLSYDRSYGKNNLSAVGGYSWQREVKDGFKAFGTNAQSSHLESNNLGGLADVDYGSISSFKDEWTLISFFARAAYNYDQRYFATVTMRRDGSSKFGANNKWGTFPSGSLAWAVKNEDFLKDAAWLNVLKLRVGYGLTGNTEGFSPYWSLPVIYPTGMQPSMEDGVSNTVVYQTSRDANPDLKWETMQELNLGLDWGIFNNKLQGSIEVYSRRTVDLIYEYSLPQPPSKTGRVMANAGIMTNKGIEANISYQVLNTKAVNYKTMFTFSHNKNNVEQLSDGIYNWKDQQQGYISARGMVGQWTQFMQEGMPMGTWYLPHFVSMSPDGAFLYETATGGVTRDILQAVRKNAGSAVPKVNLGWSNSILINNFDVNFTFRAMLGYKVYNVSKMYFSDPKLLPNFNANQQAVEWFEKKIDGTPVASDYWLEDGSFLRLDNLTLGYTMPNTRKHGINKLRFYLTGSNLLTLTGYKGIDPEINTSGMSFGLDNFNTYPKTRNYTVGVQLNF